MKEIKIKTDNTLTRLAGNEFGERVFNEQVKDNIDYSKINVIVFPDNINNVAISFVQGFIKNIPKNISLDEFNNIFKIEGNEKVIRNFIKALNY